LKRPQKQKTYRWHISRIRKKGEFVGIVKAPDEATAIREAIERWDIGEKSNQSGRPARVCTHLCHIH
jgi:hypothetical protein